MEDWEQAAYIVFKVLFFGLGLTVWGVACLAVVFHLLAGVCV